MQTDVAALERQFLDATKSNGELIDAVLSAWLRALQLGKTSQDTLKDAVQLAVANAKCASLEETEVIYMQIWTAISSLAAVLLPVAEKSDAAADADDTSSLSSISCKPSRSTGTDVVQPSWRLKRAPPLPRATASSLTV